jgi:nucleoside-diphosphate-sugar epimerase
MQKVLVTGAAGFLGGWVVEAFLRGGIPVRAGIRSWNSAVRLARCSADIVPCDVLSPEQLRAALQGCDAVVNCAVGDDRVTVTGTRNVLAVARELRLRRVVHISSVAVYGKAPGLIDEAQARRSRGIRYARRKIAAEKACEEFIDRGTPVVMLRPSIIYGPFSEVWTVNVAKRLISGKWGTLGRGGDGKCNLVYVTDVVQAIYMALTSAHAPGEAFNVNGDEIITWNDYFTRFNDALGREPLHELAMWRMALRARLVSPLRVFGRSALSRFRGPLTKIHARSELTAKYLTATETLLKLTPTSEQLKLYGLDAAYVIDKARSRLGYLPKVSIDRGLGFCVSWLQHHGILY